MNEQDASDNSMYERLDREFDILWLDICDMAGRMGVEPSYVEEECYILGELFPLDGDVFHDLCTEVLKRVRDKENKRNEDDR